MFIYLQINRLLSAGKSCVSLSFFFVSCLFYEIGYIFLFSLVNSIFYICKTNYTHYRRTDNHVEFFFIQCSGKIKKKKWRLENKY